MAVLATDNFNRANNANLGANWTNNTTLDTGIFQILSNTAATPGASLANICWAVYTNVAFPNDQWSQCQLIASDANYASGPMVRSTTATTNGYFLLENQPQNTAPGSTCPMTISKEVSGVFSNILSCTAGCNLNDTMWIGAQGTTISAQRNQGGIGSVTDNSLSSGSAAIFGEEGGTDSTHIQLDNWQGGDFDTLLGGIVV